MSITKGKLGAIYGNYTASAAATGEACELESGYTYKITDITKRYWDKAQTVTVYENAVPSTKAYTLEYPGGRIVFPEAPTTPVTVDCYYYKAIKSGGFQEWSIDNIGMELEDVTEFGSQWVTRESLVGDFGASAERYWVSEFYPDAIINGTLQLIFIFYEKLDMTQKINPWVIGNMELDDDANGIANGWAAHSAGSPTGVRSLISGGAFAGAKYQRINVTVAGSGEQYGIVSSGLGNAAYDDQVVAQIRYKTIGVTGNILAKAYLGTGGSIASIPASNDWASVTLSRKYSGGDTMDLYIYLTAMGAFTGDAKLDIDWISVYHLPSGNAQKRWEGYGRLPSINISAPTKGLVREALSIEGDGPIYYRTDEIGLGGQT